MASKEREREIRRSPVNDGPIEKEKGLRNERRDPGAEMGSLSPPL